ncbi:MAG: efflux transporter outer membrane subunit [Alphaproteobacteria bacterium]|nr:efflux transporter outer membrane subunit [Alphaproteobacteria bacterium]
MADLHLSHPLRAGLVCALSLGLWACSSQPAAYHRPDAGLPASWSPLGAVNPAALPAPLPWQSLYTDLRLQALIRTALERNHDLRLALARIDEARALWGVQRADQVPTVNVGGSHTGARTPPMVQGNPSAVNVRRYDLGLNLLSFEIDAWGRVASLSEAARMNFQASEEDRRAIRMGLISEVAQAYYVWLEALQRLTLLQQTEHNREQLLALVQRRSDLGAASDLEVVQAQSALFSARAERNAMRRQSEQARSALNLMVGGQWPTQLPEGLPWPLQTMDLTWGADLSSEILLRRPDVRAAEQRLMASNANIHAARAAFLPRLQLTGLLGSANPALGNLLGGGSQAWSLVPGLQQPIFDGGRTEAGLDLAQARKNQFVVNYEKVLQQAFREVADALIARDTLSEQLREQTASLGSLRERERLTSLRLRHGAASLSEWLDTQREVLQAEQSLVQTQRQWLSVSTQLFKALGGGEL